MINVYQAQVVNEADRGEVMFKLAMMRDAATIQTLAKDRKIKFVRVASVDTDDLDKAFELTNHIDRDWQTNPGVTSTEGRYRSTSTGDVMVKNGEQFVVATFGFEKVSIDLNPV